MLQLPARNSKPWDQRITETAAEYGAFRRWLGSNPREAPEVTYSLLAARHDWAERAAAFDNLADLPDDPVLCLQRAHADAARLLCLAAAKTLKKEAESRDSSLTPAELFRLFDVFTRLGGTLALQSIAKSQLAATKLTDEQLRLVQEAYRLTQGD